MVKSHRVWGVPLQFLFFFGSKKQVELQLLQSLPTNPIKGLPGVSSGVAVQALRNYVLIKLLDRGLALLSTHEAVVNVIAKSSNN